MQAERVERHLIKSSHILYNYCDNVCFRSKNLYNLANYYIRQVFIGLSSDNMLEQQQEIIKTVNGKIPEFDKRREKNFNKKKEQEPEEYKDENLG